MTGGGARSAGSRGGSAGLIGLLAVIAGAILLVTGGTVALARMVADGLREEGFDADVVPAGRVRRLDFYDAVVVGGALSAQLQVPGE